MDCEYRDIGELWMKSEGDINGDFGSEDLDHVPLLRRRSMLMLLENTPHSHSPSSTSQLIPKPFMSSVVVKEENEESSAPDFFSFMPACPSSELAVELLEQEQNHDEYKEHGEETPDVLSNTIVEHSAVVQCLLKGTCDQDVGTGGDFSNGCPEQIKCQKSDDNFAQLGKIDSNVCSLPRNSTLSEVPAKVKVEHSDDLLQTMVGGMHSSSGADVPKITVKDETSDRIAYDHLDHVVLKERQSMLLSRKLQALAKPVPEDSSEALLGNLIQWCAEKGIEETHDVIGEPVEGNNEICSSTGKSMEPNSDGGMGSVLICRNAVKSSSFSSCFKINDEPQDENNCHNRDRNAGETFSSNFGSVKTEMGISNELDEDGADHISLGDRAKLLRSGNNSMLNLSRSDECLKKSVPFSTEGTASESVKPFNITHPRKRKKTATDSVETALEEDAPGLLQVLVEKGVSVDEIKLYGEMENDEALDESSSEDSFSELEAVISKLYTQRSSFLKLAPIRFIKGARASYCLACLISLVEQTRYLQFRKWPVEWGWCRDLQSFLFVFERHNRIVLERPEYGYATYFFELVDSLPIGWQVKRLVTAMKLTTCSRISLIENKALTVGEDLTEGEAKVLIEYGWAPNSGLGTMLNYCDRVVHDRKNEKDTSEWRSKIGKLLMDGYNGGTIVATDVPKKVMEYRDSHSAQIKLELHD